MLSHPCHCSGSIVLVDRGHRQLCTGIWGRAYQVTFSVGAYCDRGHVAMAAVTDAEVLSLSPCDVVVVPGQLQVDRALDREFHPSGVCSGVVQKMHRTERVDNQW